MSTKEWIGWLSYVAVLSTATNYIITPTAQPLEKGQQQQFWDIHQYPVREGLVYIGTIHVFKFQVGKTMVCKAMFFKEESQTEKNNIGDVISTAVAMTATSLGDVPCD